MDLVEFDKLTDTSKVNGTHYQGTLQTTFNTLEQVFGEPLYPNSADGKVICEWVLEFSDGVIATIYCWKVSSVPMEEYGWHVGGHEFKAFYHVVSTLTQSMKQLNYA